MATRTQARNRTGVIGAIRVDLATLHGAWMEVIFPRQRGRGHSVMGKWKPETLPQAVSYYSWYLIGALGLLCLYPLAVVGLGTRFYASKLDSTVTRLGIVGITLVAVVIWGLLSALAYLQLEWEPFVAIAAASSVAVVSTAIAATTSKYGGRWLSVLIAYPFAMTAIFLPPVAAALVTPSLEPYVLEPSYDFAAWLLNNVLYVGGISDYFRDNFELEGAAYAGMWFGFAVTSGWLFGILVSLANLVRPSPDDGDDEN
ncbi:hypothetical protein Halru_1833 [Halovivax ruber XH-70]|uniref:Uncharacterized protein n=1 Tax=Halovivax ruber (strain DSM 18193 / JCM 13892 / XH-70) TaxID=797302 RepID=L0IEP2_HALRX|nr:hypothetical protein [Halovivax ruber]AGB16432.1 hypothetical protein Halru_1833 [Halovivax ruber XH-70]